MQLLTTPGTNTCGQPGANAGVERVTTSGSGAYQREKNLRICPRSATADAGECQMACSLDPQVLGSNPRGRTKEVAGLQQRERLAGHSGLPGAYSGVCPGGEILTGTRRLVVVSSQFVATVRERFEAKGEDRDGHRIWLGSCDAAGTPPFRVDGRLTTARRVAWELNVGPGPAERLVMACPQVRGYVGPGMQNPSCRWLIVVPGTWNVLYFGLADVVTTYPRGVARCEEEEEGLAALSVEQPRRRNVVSRPEPR